MMNLALDKFNNRNKTRLEQEKESYERIMLTYIKPEIKVGNGVSEYRRMRDN